MQAIETHWFSYFPCSNSCCSLLAFCFLFSLFPCEGFVVYEKSGHSGFIFHKGLLWNAIILTKVFRKGILATDVYQTSKCFHSAMKMTHNGKVYFLKVSFDRASSQKRTFGKVPFPVIPHHRKTLLGNVLFSM